jgi:propionyl-CoA synthetase
MQNFYNINPKDTFWAGDVGWAVGHSYGSMGPIGCAPVLCTKETRNARWARLRVIEQHKVKSLLFAPTAIRAIKKKIRHEL